VHANCIVWISPAVPTHPESSGSIHGSALLHSSSVARSSLVPRRFFAIRSKKKFKVWLARLHKEWLLVCDACTRDLKAVLYI